MKNLRIGLFLAAAVLLSANFASAHVVVRPDTVGVAKYQTFDMSVPVEKDMPTVGLRLVMPAGVQSVMPNAMPGWNISVKKDDQGNVTEISWTGGSLPAGFRQDFMFSAKTPAQESNLVWKAYQTYKDGSIVSWDADPNAQMGDDDDSGNKPGPYSQTKVVNDLSQGNTQAAAPAKDNKSMDAFTLSVIAVVISVLALYFAKIK